FSRIRTSGADISKTYRFCRSETERKPVESKPGIVNEFRSDDTRPANLQEFIRAWSRSCERQRRLIIEWLKELVVRCKPATGYLVIGRDLLIDSDHVLILTECSQPGP